MADDELLTHDDAAALLLRTLLNRGVDPAVRAMVTRDLVPADMYRIEYMMILEAAQALERAGRPIRPT